mmetsp:Transcript_79663/g.215730  ORF Transcript_79663/g.215730 Transcript_79663/m.215730 type:complete len:334 (+) Transcript_79663:994-1995(+)
MGPDLLAVHGARDRGGDPRPREHRHAAAHDPRGPRGAQGWRRHAGQARARRLVVQPARVRQGAGPRDRPQEGLAQDEEAVLPGDVVVRVRHELQRGIRGDDAGPRGGRVPGHAAAAHQRRCQKDRAAVVGPGQREQGRGSLGQRPEQRLHLRPRPGAAASDPPQVGAEGPVACAPRLRPGRGHGSGAGARVGVASGGRRSPPGADRRRWRRAGRGGCHPGRRLGEGPAARACGWALQRHVAGRVAQRRRRRRGFPGPHGRHRAVPAVPDPHRLLGRPGPLWLRLPRAARGYQHRLPGPVQQRHRVGRRQHRVPGRLAVRESARAQAEQLRHQA